MGFSTWVRMLVLGLDISTAATGWATVQNGDFKDFGTIIPPNELVEKGLFKTKKAAKESLKGILPTFRYVAGRCVQVIQAVDPDHLVIEDIYLGPNVKVLSMLSRLSGGPLFYWMYSKAKPGLGKRTFLISACSARAYLGCKGNAKKSQVLDFINNGYGLDLIDDNQGDAAVLAMYGYRKCLEDLSE